MISAWWLIPAVFAGAVFGIFLLGIISSGRDGRDE
jgi:hypothetical protein